MSIRFLTLLPVAALVAVAAAELSAFEARQVSPVCYPLCCKFTEESNPTTLSKVNSQFGAELPNIAGLIGVDCFPIPVASTDVIACPAYRVCCIDSGSNGAVGVGCIPIDPPV